MDHRKRLHDKLVVVIMAFLIALQPVATDLYLPALPLLSSHFNAPIEVVQLTLSVLIVFYGLGQLIWGPVSDRYGRRPVLLCGLVLYTLGALVAATASSIDIVIAGRGIQGAGLAATIVCARAMTRDLYEPPEAAHIVSRAMSILACMSALAPGAGGVIATFFGWRATLLATGLISAGLLALYFFRIPETYPGPNSEATKIGTLIASYKRIASHPTFITWTTLSTLGFAANVGFYSSCSYVYIQHFNLSTQSFGLLLGSGSVAYFLGTVSCRRRIAAWGIHGTIKFASIVSLLSAVIFILPAIDNTHSIFSMTAALWIHLFAYGHHQPCGHVGMIAPFPNQAGIASALGGCALAIGAFLGATISGYAHDGTASGLAFLTGSLVGASATIALVFVGRYGEVRTHPL